MKKLALALSFSFLMAGTVWAQDTTALAERYIKLPALQVMLDSVLGSGFLDPMIAAMGGGSLAPEKREQLVKIVTEELAAIRPEMEAAMVASAADTYSAAELEALIAFNSTPEAESIMRKLQTFNAAYLGKLGPAMGAMQSKIQQRVASEITP